MVIGQFGNIAYERFLDAREAQAPQEQMSQHLNDAANRYHEELSLLPADAVAARAGVHNQLGIIYRRSGQIDRALEHYRKSIHYEEQQDNTYGAAQSRYNAAVALADAGRWDDARLYAHAALRDFRAVGPGAAKGAEMAQQLIDLLEQAPSE